MSGEGSKASNLEVAEKLISKEEELKSIFNKLEDLDEMLGGDGFIDMDNNYSDSNIETKVEAKLGQRELTPSMELQTKVNILESILTRIYTEEHNKYTKEKLKEKAQDTLKSASAANNNAGNQAEESKSDSENHQTETEQQSSKSQQAEGEASKKTSEANSDVAAQNKALKGNEELGNINNTDIGNTQESENEQIKVVYMTEEMKELSEKSLQLYIELKNLISELDHKQEKLARLLKDKNIDLGDLKRQVSQIEKEIKEIESKVLKIRYRQRKEKAIFNTLRDKYVKIQGLAKKQLLKAERKKKEITISKIDLHDKLSREAQDTLSKAKDKFDKLERDLKSNKDIQESYSQIVNIISDALEDKKISEGFLFIGSERRNIEKSFNNFNETVAKITKESKERKIRELNQDFQTLKANSPDLANILEKNKSYFTIAENATSEKTITNTLIKEFETRLKNISKIDDALIQYAAELKTIGIRKENDTSYSTFLEDIEKYVEKGIDNVTWKNAKTVIKDITEEQENMGELKTLTEFYKKTGGYKYTARMNDTFQAEKITTYFKEIQDLSNDLLTNTNIPDDQRPLILQLIKEYGFSKNQTAKAYIESKKIDGNIPKSAVTEIYILKKRINNYIAQIESNNSEGAQLVLENSKSVKGILEQAKVILESKYLSHGELKDEYKKNLPADIKNAIKEFCSKNSPEKLLTNQELSISEAISLRNRSTILNKLIKKYLEAKSQVKSEEELDDFGIDTTFQNLISELTEDTSGESVLKKADNFIENNLKDSYEIQKASTEIMNTIVIRLKKGDPEMNFKKLFSFFKKTPDLDFKLNNKETLDLLKDISLAGSTEDLLSNIQLVLKVNNTVTQSDLGDNISYKYYDHLRTETNNIKISSENEALLFKDINQTLGVDQDKKLSIRKGTQYSQQAKDYILGISLLLNKMDPKSEKTQKVKEVVKFAIKNNAFEDPRIMQYIRALSWDDGFLATVSGKHSDKMIGLQKQTQSLFELRESFGVDEKGEIKPYAKQGDGSIILLGNTSDDKEVAWGGAKKLTLQSVELNISQTEWRKKNNTAIASYILYIDSLPDKKKKEKLEQNIKGEENLGSLLKILIEEEKKNSNAVRDILKKKTSGGGIVDILEGMVGVIEGEKVITTIEAINKIFSLGYKEIDKHLNRHSAPIKSTLENLTSKTNGLQRISKSDMLTAIKNNTNGARDILLDANQDCPGTQIETQGLSLLQEAKSLDAKEKLQGKIASISKNLAKFPLNPETPIEKIEKATEKFINDIISTPCLPNLDKKFQDIFGPVINLKDKQLVGLLKGNLESMIAIADLKVEIVTKKTQDELEVLLGKDGKEEYEKLNKMLDKGDISFPQFKKKLEEIGKGRIIDQRSVNELIQKLIKLAKKKYKVKSFGRRVKVNFSEKQARDLINGDVSKKEMSEPPESEERKKENERLEKERDAQINKLKGVHQNYGDETKTIIQTVAVTLGGEKGKELVQSFNKILPETGEENTTSIATNNTKIEPLDENIGEGLEKEEAIQAGKKAIEKLKEGTPPAEAFKEYLKEHKANPEKALKKVEEKQIEYNKLVAEKAPELWEPLTQEDVPNTSPEELKRINFIAVQKVNQSGSIAYISGSNIPDGRLVTNGGVNYIYHGGENGNRSLISPEANNSGKYNSVLISPSGEKINIEISKNEKKLIEIDKNASENLYNFYDFFQKAGIPDIGDFKDEMITAYGSTNINIKGNLDKDDLLKFSKFLLQVLFGKDSKESKVINLDDALKKFRDFSEYGVFNKEKTHGQDGLNRFSYILKELEINNKIAGFKIETIEQAAKGKGLIWMLEEKNNTKQEKFTTKEKHVALRELDKTHPELGQIFTSGELTTEELDTIKKLGL